MTDPYVDPASGVLRNRLGIADRDRLWQAEAELTTAALAVLIDTPLPGSFDLVHLQAFHRRIFGRIYPWAGEIRTVAIAKTDMFCLPQHIETYASSTFEELAGDKHLRGLPRDSFVDRLTHYFAEVNAIHPFREGNDGVSGLATAGLAGARSSRFAYTASPFFGQLSREAGWPIDWSELDPDENSETAIASLRGDNGPLRTMLDRLIVAGTTGRTSPGGGEEGRP